MIFPHKRMAEKQQRICRRQCETAETIQSYDEIFYSHGTTIIPYKESCFLTQILQSRIGRTIHS
jgi:hypothetical protein